MSWQNNEIDLDKFISYDEATNIAQCLIPECHTVFIGKRNHAIKRHYRIAHKMTIDEIEEEATENYHNIETNHNRGDNSAGECNPFVSYSIKYVNDKGNGKANSNSEHHNDANSEGGKGYRTFLVADYVDYNKETNMSKCLVKNCERPMSGRRTGNIKRHYHKVHNFVIVHDNQEEASIRDMNKELREYYNNDLFGDSASSTSRVDEDIDDEMSDNSEQQQPVNYEQYIDYDPLINKSLCKVPGCKAYLAGKKPFSIARHYGLVHNYDIESNGIKLFDKSKYTKVTNVQLTNSALIPVDDLVAYDIKSQTYQCLFINCNLVLEKHLPIIKRHYHEKHKIIIARDSDNIPHRFYRKRKQQDFQQHYDQEFYKEYQEFSHEIPTYSIKNELLSDDEQPQCSKKPKNNHLNYIIPETESSAIKKEYTSEDEQPSQQPKILKEKYVKNETITSHSKPNIKNNSCKIEINLTKQKFFNLCVGLVIERNIPLNLFDDETFFKPLLAPYEQVFDCEINSTKMEDLMFKANNMIINDLKDIFNNKVVCLDLNVVKHEMKYYLIFNVRFMEEETVQNKIIGFLSITETTTSLPISKYLNKFNINEQHIYMKTILTGLHEDEQIYKICDNLCKHNPDIKYHPIYNLQIILKTFKQKYSQDIKNWQELSNYKDEDLNQNIVHNLREFSKHLKEIDMEEKSELQVAKQFLKSLEIFSNFMDKLSGEQYVAGDFYRDWLCCELELKSELKKNNNVYAGNLSEELLASKNALLEWNEFTAALYLDVRFNFLASRLITDDQKTKAKLFLCSLGEKFDNIMQSASTSAHESLNTNKTNEDEIDDEYALLNEHINDIMPAKCNESLEDKLTNCVPTKREPFSLDILKYWHSNRQNMEDINELTKIAFTFPCSNYVLNNLQLNFNIFKVESEKFDKFLFKFNRNILQNKLDLII